MSILRITGRKRLCGKIDVQGAKNSVLPILAAAILADGETVIHNCPELSDVNAAIKILTHLGCSVKREENTISVNPRGISRCDIPDMLMREMRSSVIFLGAILARCGEAVLSMPGGCELGPRPIDMHLEALRALGTDITESGGNIICKAKRLRGCRIDLATPSVGATENSILAASAADGTTVITNVAREPEIVDLSNYLNSLGAKIYGAGTSVITIEGVNSFITSEHTVIPDRIAASTYMCAVASAGGSAEICNIIPEHIITVSNALESMGCNVRILDDRVIISSDTRLKAIRPIITKPYPGFPTDAQPPLMSACLTAEGTTVFVENIFMNRYRHVSELLRLGADIKVEGRVAIVGGVEKLHAAPVKSTDLRGGAALVVAALGAEGVTEVSAVHHIDRGYDRLELALRALGADAERIRE